MKESGKPELVKLYYRIGEVSQLVGVERHVLRYWETEFPSIRPQKSKKGQRVYSRRDVAKLLRVKELLREQGFTIAGARKRLRDPQVAEEVREQVSTIAPSQAPPASHDNSAKSMRRELLVLRRELLAHLRELSPPDSEDDHGDLDGRTFPGRRSE